MGVMACRRNNCQRIMCTRYSNTYGYICDECFDELLKVETVGISIHSFMNSPKGEGINPDRERWIEKCEEEFREGE